jgi:hypothetical protein
MGFLIDAVAACWTLAFNVLLQIKIDYLAEIIIIRIARDDMFDPRIMQHCHWWCGLSSVR